MKESDKDLVRIDGSKPMRSGAYGSPNYWIVWSAIIVGGPLLGLCGMVSSPTFWKGNDPAYAYEAPICYAVAIVFMIRIRRSVFGLKAPLVYKVLFTLIMSFPVAAAFFGGFLLLSRIFQ